MAKYKKPSGSNCYKKARTAQEAIEFLAGRGDENVAEDDDASEESPPGEHGSPSGDLEAPSALDEA